MTKVTTKETQKAGDTLIISGQFEASAARAAATNFLYQASWWLAATITVNVWNVAGVLVVDGALITSIDVSPLSNASPELPTYFYQGTMPDEGAYEYEIQAVSSGLTLTWPNNGSKHRLKVIPELG